MANGKVRKEKQDKARQVMEKAEKLIKRKRNLKRKRGIKLRMKLRSLMT